MTDPTVASVLVIVHDARRHLLLPWLHADGEPVTYTVETTTPRQSLALFRATAPRWDVIVVDGESLLDDESRAELLRALRAYGAGLVTLLYVCTRLPTEVEARTAFEWAHDQVDQGWEFGRRLQRRVQCVALAPWRRSVALRVEAQRRGDRRVRVLRNVEESSR